MHYPTIEHHGARDGVTGSCHQLHIDRNHSLLIDCGLFQGAEVSGAGASAERMQIEFPLDTVKALIATHVHIDHVGRIPWLLAAGFYGPILCSEPSAKLLPIVLEDAFKLGVSRDRSKVENYLRHIESRLRPLPYKHWHTLIETPEVVCRIRLQRAGHILGSAYVECDLRYPTQSRERRIVFSGDLGAPYAPILPAPKSPWKADTVVLESTYGDRQHENRKTRRQRLKQCIIHALRDQGTVLIPAFSIGRTQELLYEIEDLIHRGRDSKLNRHLAWDQLPIVLDSPLASRFTRVYRELQPYWDAEALKRLRGGRRPLGFDQLLTVDSHEQHLKMVAHLSQSGRPAVVIAGSGMCTSGRIVNYLKAMLGDRRHDVVFVGYQAAGTPGRDIQQYGPRGGYVFLDGEKIDIRAGVYTLGGYSAHADQKGLVNFVSRMRHGPSEVRLIHGDDGAKRDLQTALRAAFKAKGREVDVVVP